MIGACRIGETSEPGIMLRVGVSVNTVLSLGGEGADAAVALQ